MRKIKLLMFGVVLAALLALPAGAMAKSRDRDHDRLPDKWEHKFHLSTHHKSGKGDPDRDGLNNRGEFKSKTNPRKADTDRDGVLDANEDPDRDGVDNANEVRERTNPRRKDSDRDGRRDGQEDADRDRLNNTGEDQSGNDPIKADTDGDGVKDGDEGAGKVV